MDSSKHITIVGNFEPSQQFSMLAYERLLVRMLQQVRNVDVVTVRPVPILVDRFKSNRKIFQYLDRFLIAPFRFPRADTAIIVDQGYAHYAHVLRAKRLIVVCHDMIAWLYGGGRLAGWRPSPAGRLLLAANLSGLRQADHIICVSKATRNDLIRIAGVDEERSSTVLNCVRDDLPIVLNPWTSKMARSVGADNRAIILAFGGTVYKNIDTSIAIFRALRAELGRDCCLVVVGMGPEEAQRWNAKIGGDNSIVFAGRITDGQLAELYSVAALLLFPSLYEGFGWPVLEAQRFNLPVICGEGGSLREIAGDGALMFSPMDVSGMTQAARTILSDAHFSDALRERGRRNLKRFTYGRWRDDMLAVLKRTNAIT